MTPVISTQKELPLNNCQNIFELMAEDKEDILLNLLQVLIILISEKKTQHISKIMFTIR
jgi:hypothetical protein